MKHCSYCSHVEETGRHDFCPKCGKDVWHTHELQIGQQYVVTSAGGKTYTPIAKQDDERYLFVGQDGTFVSWWCKLTHGTLDCGHGHYYQTLQRAFTAEGLCQQESCPLEV